MSKCKSCNGSGFRIAGNMVIGCKECTQGAIDISATIKAVRGRMNQYAKLEAIAFLTKPQENAR